eukprot:14690559-Alexandrium_andersonii.AAC.1
MICWVLAESRAISFCGAALMLDCMQGLQKHRLLGLSALEALELLGARGEQRLHGTPSFADRLALGLELESGLANQARDCLARALGERALG